MRRKDGELLVEEEEIRKRWKEYVEELYDKVGKPTQESMTVGREDEVQEWGIGPDLMEEEIEGALKDLKEKKAEGIDGMGYRQSFGEMWVHWQRRK